MKDYPEQLEIEVSVEHTDDMKTIAVIFNCETAMLAEDFLLALKQYLKEYEQDIKDKANQPIKGDMH